MKQALAALALCYAIFFTCLVATGRELPARLASHFDASGNANGWMSRGTYAEVMIALTVLAPASLIACAILIRILVGRSELAANRPGTLLADKREITAVVLRYVIVYCALLVLFLTGMHLLVALANTSTDAPILPLRCLWAVVGVFVAATLVWSVLLCRRCVQLTLR